MKKMIKYSLVLALSMLLVVVLFSSLAYAATSVVHDPRGDVGSSAPYLDVANAEVIEQQGQETLLFQMQLAGLIPKAPSESVVFWVFHLDTDPTAFPGTPPLWVDYVVRVMWSNGAFVGQVVNRATGAITSVDFSIDGPTVKVFVPLATLGNPSSFGWNAATRPGLPPTPFVDFAPDAAGQFDFSTIATWETMKAVA